LSLWWFVLKTIWYDVWFPLRWSW